MSVSFGIVFYLEKKMRVGIQLQLFLLISIINEAYTGIVAPHPQLDVEMEGYSRKDLEIAERKEGCGHPEWKGDKICDDDNNNARCDFDGGDCCLKEGEKNTDYCKKCECHKKKKKEKTSNLARPGQIGHSGDCHDERSTEDCQYWKGLGLCGSSDWVYKNCEKTCENCDKTGDCKDEKSAAYCKDKSSGCHWGEMFWDCRKTCNRCNDKPSCSWPGNEKWPAEETNVSKGWHDECDCKEASECYDWASMGFCDNKTMNYYSKKCPISCKSTC